MFKIISRPLAVAVLGVVVGAGSIAFAQEAREGNRRPSAEAADRPRGGAEQGRRFSAEGYKTAVLEVAKEDQKKQLEAAFAKAQEKMTALRAEGGDRQAAGEKLMAINQELRADISKILNEEQQQQVRQKMAVSGVGRGPGQIDFEKLGLNEDQKAKVQKLNEELREKMSKLRDEAGGDRQAMGEKMRALMEERTAKLKEILTPEQQQKLQAMMAEQRGGEGRPGRPGGERGPGGEGRPRPQQR